MSVTRSIVPLAAAAVVLGAISATGKRKGKGGGGATQPPMPQPMSAGQDDLRYLAEWAFLDDSWITFLEINAKNESGFNTFRGLGIPSMFPDWAQPNLSASKNVQDKEAAAARKVYNRNTYLHSCPYNAARYSFGSGGWFGLLPASGVYAFKGSRYECIDPWSVFDPPAALVMAIEYARRTMRRQAFKDNPTWLTLRVGWGSPSNMGKQSAHDRVADQMRRHLGDLGYPLDFIHQPVTPLPEDNPADLLDALMEVI
jgi:hypothetical protein